MLYRSLDAIAAEDSSSKPGVALRRGDSKGEKHFGRQRVSPLCERPDLLGATNQLGSSASGKTATIIARKISNTHTSKKISIFQTLSINRSITQPRGRRAQPAAARTVGNQPKRLRPSSDSFFYFLSCHNPYAIAIAQTTQATHELKSIKDLQSPNTAEAKPPQHAGQRQARVLRQPDGRDLFAFLVPWA